MILETLSKNVSKAKEIIKEAVPSMPGRDDCACADALKYAVVTDDKVIPDKTRRDLELLIGKYGKK